MVDLISESVSKKILWIMFDLPQMTCICTTCGHHGKGTRHKPLSKWFPATVWMNSSMEKQILNVNDQGHSDGPPMGACYGFEGRVASMGTRSGLLVYRLRFICCVLTRAAW